MGGRVYREQEETRNKEWMRMWKESQSWKERSFSNEFEIKRLRRVDDEKTEELRRLNKEIEGYKHKKGGTKKDNVNIYKEKGNDRAREAHRNNEEEKRGISTKNRREMTRIINEDRGKNRDERRYCHYWNNGGCMYNDNECRYKHYRAPACRDGGNCRRYKCMFGHEQKESAGRKDEMMRSGDGVRMEATSDWSMGHSGERTNRIGKARGW